MREGKNLLASNVMAYKLQHVPEDHQRFHSISPFFVFSQEKNTRNFCALAQRLLQLEATATTSARYIWLQLFLVSFTSYLFLDSQSAAYSNPTLF